MTTDTCFHCEDAIPAGINIVATIGETPQRMCCHGCRAASEFIAAAGLDQFYQHRAPIADAVLRPEQHNYAAFDKTDISRQFVATDDNGICESTIYIGDLYCPACIWLIDQVLTGYEGIESVGANPASRRIIVRWHKDATTLGAILAQIATVGFKPEPVTPGSSLDAERTDYRSAIKRLVVAGVFGMQAMMFAIGLYAGEFYGMEDSQAQLLRVVSLIVTLPIMGFAALPFFRGAIFSLKQKRPGMDVPVSLALIIAFSASLMHTVQQAGDVYYDSIAMFVLLLCLSRFLEMRARHNADDRAQALAVMLPAAVTRLNSDGEPELVALSSLAPSDRLQLQRGDVIAVDGRIYSGHLSVDESMMTGESDPVVRGVGERVLAGTTVMQGDAIIDAAATGASTQLGEISRLIEKAQHDRSHMQTLSDRFASVFVLAVLGLAALTALVWWQMAPERTLPIVLSVLIVACPCALALATPTALASAASMLSRNGMLLIRARILDCLHVGSVIVFDKTGTLTRGKPEVASSDIFDRTRADKQQCLAIAALLEAESGHVLANAFDRFMPADMTLDEPAVVTLAAGVSGVIGGTEYRIGKLAFVTAIAGDRPLPAPSSDMVGSEVFLGCADGLLARFVVCDTVRSDATSVLASLRNAGFELVIASGDNNAAVQGVASQLGIADYHSDQTPQDKLSLVRRLKRESKRVIMVGDGVNDAPVMAAADASVAIANGTALARSSADSVLLGNSLTPLLSLTQIASRTRRVIRQSLIWAASYNLIAVSFASLGWVAPWMAALGMSASSLLVVSNALRINRPLAKPQLPAIDTTSESRSVYA